MSALIEYQQVISELEGRSIMPKAAPALTKTKQALVELGFYFPASRVIVVAGTNGKGTVCATLQALLAECGLKVGLYTSPHLEDTCERIQINGEQISYPDFVDVYRLLQKKVPVFSDLTHFEALTVMALSYFTQRRVDWMILEVGLGGLWDATNAVPHATSVITPIGFDHQDLLGSTLGEIAANKFGIVQPGNCVVHARFSDELRALYLQIKERTQSQWFEAPVLDYSIENGKHYWVRLGEQKFPLQLLGRRAVENTSIALEVFKRLGFDPMLNAHALAQVRWPGRMEEFQLPQIPCPLFLSGDHNVPGVLSLIEILERFRWETLYLLVGICKSKEFKKMIDLFCSIQKSKIVLTTTPFMGLDERSYGEEVLKKTYLYKSDPDQALESVCSEAKKNDLIVVSGSLYLVGWVRKKIKTLLQDG